MVPIFATTGAVSSLDSSMGVIVAVQFDSPTGSSEDKHPDSKRKRQNTAKNMGDVVRPVRMTRRNGLVLLSLAVGSGCRDNNYARNFPRQNMNELPTPEQQLAANQQLLKILPFVLGFGCIVMIPISYLFIAPVVSNDLGIQIGVAIGIVVATGIADLVFLKIMTKNVETMMWELEETVQESENSEQYSPESSILG